MSIHQKLYFNKRTQKWDSKKPRYEYWGKPKLLHKAGAYSFERCVIRDGNFGYVQGTKIFYDGMFIKTVPYRVNNILEYKGKL